MGSSATTEPVLDVLAYTKDLEGAGFNRTQAEAIARGSFALFKSRFDRLVNREHFDNAIGSVESRRHDTGGMLQRFDVNFERIGSKLGQLETSVNRLHARLDQTNTTIDHIDLRVDRVELPLDAFEPIKNQVNILIWMMGLVVLVLVVPQLQSWSGGS